MSEEFAQVGVGIDFPAAATLDDRVKDRAALTGSGFADEEPVHFPKRRRSDRVLDEVVVDLDAALLEINFQRGPLAQGIVDGLTEQALRQVAAAGFAEEQNFAQAFDDGTALVGTHRLAQDWAGLAFPQPCFDPVEVLDLAQEPAGSSGRLFASFVELAPRVGPSATEFYAVAPLGEGAIGAVAVALNDAFELAPDKAAACLPFTTLSGRRRGSSGWPGKRRAWDNMTSRKAGTMSPLVWLS